MPDPRRQDAALAAATTIWHLHDAPLVLPLTVAHSAIHGARLCGGAFPRLALHDEPTC